MRTEHDLLDRVEEIENEFITLRDGCRIAARIWLPKGARIKPVPAILEYLPYRKRDFMRSRDEAMHRYFAAHGYAALRVDIRGSGDSAGIIKDEYTPQEQEDALEIIEWITNQIWCSGNVGMMGISWGGFNALQIAAMRPAALKAVISLCASDDRYADDAHFMGGCLLNENLQWGSIFMLYASLPPDPQIIGEDWRTMWHERLSALDAFPALWMDHPLRDDYWKQGSVCEDFSAIECPVYLIGGWADGYSNAVARLLHRLRSPKKALIGPWAHCFPHEGIPGPAIGFLQEAVRWWDRWLKNENNEIMDEPMLRVWMQESVPPQPQYAVWPGRWVAEEQWPSERITRLSLALNLGHLDETADEEMEVSFSSPQTTGVRAGEWCGFGSDGDMPRDQRSDDGGSLVFDSDPLTERIELLGAPAIDLDLSVDRPNAFICARLCDVAPDGSVLRVSYGLLNLTHDEAHEQSRPIEPGRRMRVRLQLNDLAHAFPKSHRIRVSLSTSYWPIAWPSPEPVIVTVHTGISRIELPVRAPSPADETLRPFEEPAAAPSATHKKLQARPLQRSVEIDLTTNEMVYTLKSDGGEFDGASLARIESVGLDIGYTFTKRYRIVENDPLSAQAEIEQRALLRRGNWEVRVSCATRLRATADEYLFSGEMEALEGQNLVAHRRWDVPIPRNGM